jgi:hypothetical protein
MAGVDDLIHLGAPHTRDEIRAEQRRVDAEAGAFLESLSAERFFAPFGEAWSPADNVRHLLKSVRPVVFALGLPAFLLRLLFGAAKGPSRSLEALRTDYRALLAAGGKAGRFAPAPRPAPADPEAARRRLLGRWRAAESDLDRAAARWDEVDLDRYRLPHPLLGKLTLREMLLFSLYHGVHHVGGVARRMGSWPKTEVPKVR